MKTFLYALAVAACALPAASPVNAAPETLEPAIRDSLTRISARLLRDHHEEFIIVDALRDGFIGFDQRFDLSYDSTGVRINGQALPAAANALYLRRLQDFRVHEGGIPGLPYSGGTSGDGFSLKSVLDPGFVIFRKQTPFAAYAENDEKQRNSRKIIDELIRDGVIGDGADYTVRCAQEGVFVDNVALAPALNEKYRTLFRVMMGVDPTDGRGTYSMSSSSRTGKR